MKNTVCELSPLITARKIELLLTASIFFWCGNMCFLPASVSIYIYMYIVYYIYLCLHVRCLDYLGLFQLLSIYTKRAHT